MKIEKYVITCKREDLPKFLAALVMVGKVVDAINELPSACGSDGVQIVYF